MTMTNSRLAQMQFAKRDFDRAMELNPNSSEWPVRALVKLLVEVAENPAPADSPQRKPEAFYAESTARYLFEKVPFLLNYCGFYEQTYSLIQDPSVLSGSIVRALVESPASDHYDKHQEILAKALDLGGLIMPKHSLSNQNMINPTAARSHYSFTKLSQAKQLLENQAVNNWVAQYEEYDGYNLANYLIFLVGYVGDQDPAWAVDYTLKNSDFLEPLMKGNSIAVENPLARAFAAVLHGTTTADMLLAIKPVRPDIYDALLESEWMPLFLQKLIVLPDFKLASLAPHHALTQELHAELFVRFGRLNALTEAKFQDIEQSWLLSGFEEKMIAVVRNSEDFKNFAGDLKAYKDLLRSPNLTAKDLVEKKGKFGFAGENFPLFDALVHRAADRISRSETLMTNHSAFGMTSHWLSDKSKQVSPIKAITLGVAILGLKQNKHNERLRDFIVKAFNDQVYHPEVAKLSGDLVDLALEHAPAIDQKLMRKINWEDRAIKARLLETDLGM